MRIINDFEGANPPAPGGIERTAEAQFIVRPWSEDGDGNYKFRLNVVIVNDGAASQEVDFRVAWGDEEYMRARTYVLLGRGPSWRTIEAAVEGDTTHATLIVPPGEWYLGLTPAYDLPMAAEDLARAAAGGLREQVYGRSYYGRDLYALSAGPDDAPAILIVSRCHSYETAGSYCAAGVLELLAEDLACAGPLTSAFRFVVAPMPNPDGVALGCCKRTRPEGVNLPGQGYGTDDPAALALASLLHETAPIAYVDLHGWMHQQEDWIIYSDQRVFEALRPTFDAPVFDKSLRLNYTGDDSRPRPGSFSAHAREALGAITLTPDISFYRRQPEQRRQIGRTILAGLCGALAE